MMLRSTDARESRCAVCGNCTLTALAEGHILLSADGSNCPPTPTAHTWTIDSGRRGHVVQLTVERHLVAAVPQPGIVHNLELKVRDVSANRHFKLLNFYSLVPVMLGLDLLLGFQPLGELRDRPGLP